MRIKYNHKARTLLCSNKYQNWKCDHCSRSLCLLDDYSIKDDEIETIATVIP